MLRWSSPPASTSEAHAPLAPRPPTPPPPPPPPPLLPPTRPASAPAAPVERAAPPRLCDDHLCDATGAGAEAEGAEGAEGAPLSQRAQLAQLGSIQHHLERRGEHIVVGTYCSRHMHMHMHAHMHMQNCRPARRCVTGAPPHASCRVRRAVHAAHAPRRARGAIVSGRASNSGTPRPAPALDPACADHSCLCAAACQFRRTDLGRAAYGRARTHRGLSHAAARRAPACRGRPRGRAVRGKLPRRRGPARGRGRCFRGLWWRCWLT